ncbi:MAG: Crp/Fnr family transcriptional regulator [Rikenellaceae bacterium]
MNNLDFNFFCSSCTASREYRQANCFTSYKVSHFKRGECIAYRGESAKRLSILAAGSVATELILDSGIAYTSVCHSAPYPLGALALFAEDNRYRADFIALEECTLISVSREDIEQQMCQCRRFLRSFIAYNTTKIDTFARHLTVLTQKSLKSKLAFYLLSASVGGVFHLEISLEDLATYFAVERPSLSRVIAQFVREGLITYHRGKGEILEHKALRSLLV